MSSDEYRPPLPLNPSDSGHSTASPSREVSGGSPVDAQAVQEQIVLTCEVKRLRKRNGKLEEKCRELLRESGRDENDVMRSLNDEDSFELLENVEVHSDPQQPASAVGESTKAYLEKQQSKERSVVAGPHSFTVVHKDGRLSSCKDSLKRVFQGSTEAQSLKTENEQLHKTVEELKMQLSLAEARVEDSQSFSKSGLFTRSEEGTRVTGGDETSLRQVSTLQEDLDSIKKELTRAKEDADRALQERRDMKEALDHTLEEKLQLKEAHDCTLAEKLQLKEAHDRTLAEKLRLEGEVVKQKKIAKDWKMQLDETTCRLIEKQDEIEQLQRK